MAVYLLLRKGHAYVDKALKERYEYRCDGHIGPNHDNQMVVLNRLICYEPETGKVTYEADPRHVEALVRELNLETAKAVRTPAEKKKQGEALKSMEMPPMNEAMQRSYRSITMRAAFLAQDRPDIAEATKSLARHMKAPNEAAWADLKRLGRYLRGKPRLVYEYHPQRFQKDLTVYCDSDHAGDRDYAWITLHQA
ncbi:RE2 [Symbiodinium sp. KB8]|nr:RE2 [Symbiodinium sp. KB8]